MKENIFNITLKTKVKLIGGISEGKTINITLKS